MSDEIELETKQGKPIQAVLADMPNRDAALCRTVHGWFDERFDGDTMDTIQKFAGIGWTTQTIINHVQKYWPVNNKMPDTGWELMALATEHAVRENAKIT